MNSKLITRLSSLALTACLAIGVSGAGAQTYSVTDLGILPGKKENVSTPAALNASGQVAGTSGGSAFRYTQKMEEIGQVPYGLSHGFGIDNSGQVVGDTTFRGGSVSHAALFSNGSVRDLGVLKGSGPFSRANSINASGQVVGFCSMGLDGEGARAFLVSDYGIQSGMVDLGTLGGSYAQAWGINDSGFVTGNSQTKGDFGVTHAFIWQAKIGMLDLGTLDGEYSYGTFINAKNHVVGYSTIDKNHDRVHAFLHNGREMLDLGSLGSAFADMDYSYALGINAEDQVVGYSYLPSGNWAVAFVYSKGLMVNLNDLIGDARKEYRLDCATAINDKGQIVAIAYVNSAEAFHAVLLTPIADVIPASIQITSAKYAKSGLLTVEATYTGGSSGTMPPIVVPTLTVYNTQTGEVIGKMETKDNSSYFGFFAVKGNPGKIWVESSDGARADAMVEDSEFRSISEN